MFSLIKGRVMRNLKKVWGDMGYAGKEVKEASRFLGIDFEAVSRNQKKFQITRKRWIVERTFAWLGKFRRLSKDYEQCVFSSRSWMFLSMSRILIRRLAIS